jgi:hypothetical protein
MKENLHYNGGTQIKNQIKYSPTKITDNVLQKGAHYPRLGRL